MIFLLEGPDLAGKTTLAANIAKAIEAKYPEAVIHMHKRGPLQAHENPLDQYLVPLHEMTKRADTPQVHIIDRWHAGEMIYGPLLRNASRMSQAQFNYIELVLYTYGVTPIYVNAALPTLHSRYETRGDTLSWNQIETAYRNYLEFLMLDNDHYLRVYTDTKWSTEMAMMDIVNGGVGGAPLPEVMDGYLGGMYPRVLILGDKQGPNMPAAATAQLPWPFVPWSSTSGLWLFRALSEANAHVHDIGLVNARERTPEALSSLWKRLDNPPVVSLGANAKKAAEAAGITLTEELHHPQFMRRFHHNDHMIYGQTIRKVMR